MVRFRPAGERLSTAEEIVAGESASIADRWLLGKGLALSSSREIVILSLRFAFALSARPPESPTTCLGARGGSRGETLALSSDCTLAVCCDVVDALAANGAFSADEIPDFRGNFDA